MVEYYGNENIITLTNQFLSKFKQKGAKRAIIYTGPPGVGKTYLTEHICEKYRVERILINASERRTAGAMDEILSIVRNKAPMFVVLDEVEAMSSKNISKVIKATEVPLFLCCNYIEMIDRDVIELCMLAKLDPPQWWSVKQFMLARMAQYSMEVPADIDTRAKKAKSFRHAERLIDDPDDEVPEPIETDYTQVEKILRGAYVDHVTLKPDDLITWINDNANVPELASSANVFMEHAYLDDYHHWSYVYALMQSVRSNNKVKYPRSIRLMGQIKREMKDAKRDVGVVDLKVDLTKVKMEVKSGASLFSGLAAINLDEIK
jgi:SpoVK/Ycf46/Vps4 family AAA+-type ATPase